MIKITEDLAKLLKTSEYACAVDAIADYIPAVQRIERALRDAQPLRILVRHPVCATWLRRLAASYDESEVRYTVVSAREELARQWQTAIPDSVSDADVLASGFLDAAITPRGGQSYEDIVLDHYWGDFFTFVSFPFHLTADLVESLDLDQWRSNQHLPLVMQALDARKQRWLDAAQGHDQQSLIHALFDDPHALKLRLGQYKLLNRYPASLGESVLGQWWARFRSLNLDPTPITLDELDVGATVQEIQYYLNNATDTIATLDDLTPYLDQLSGYLVEEFAWVRKILLEKFFTHYPSRITHHASRFPSILQPLTVRFQPIQAQVAEGLDALRAAVPPAYPDDPAGNQTPQQWLDWAVHSYLPYRFWLEENDRWDSTVADYAGRYADWFFANYTALSYQEQGRWVFDLLNHALLSLKEGHKVLFIIVDNLNFKHVAFLEQAFQQRGFHRQGPVMPTWAMLPTTTEVSKHCLVAGEREVANVQGATYAAILEKDWRAYFSGYQVVYTPMLNDLQKRPDFGPDLILLNYLPVDEVLHKDEKQIGTTHTGEIRHYLRALVDGVVDFAQRTKVVQNLVIFVASDHGSTKVLAERENLIDDKFYKQRAKDRHHRYISVPENRASHPTQYDEDHCYVIPASVFGTQDSYFIARGYGLFIKTQESIYVHGGLTPEETIVPFMQLAKAAIQVQPPTLRLKDNVIRYGVKQTLAVVMGNPNAYDMENVVLRIAESDQPEVTQALVPAGQTVEIDIPLRVRRPPRGQDLDAIIVQGTYVLQGQAYPLDPVRLPVEARSLMESTTDFDFF